MLAGQELFNPVDVAGWQGDQDWINSSTLGGRWLGLENFIWYTWNHYQEELRDFAIATSDYSNDPAFITKSIIDRFVPNELYTLSDYDVATVKALLHGQIATEEREVATGRSESSTGIRKWR